jgi:hypothetical protein
MICTYQCVYTKWSWFNGNMTFAPCSPRPDFCSWQAGRKRIHTRVPDVLAVAGMAVLAFQHAVTTGESSFSDDRQARSKGRGTFVAAEWEQGPSVQLTTSILSKTAGARDKRKFFNGLIVWPA